MLTNICSQAFCGAAPCCHTSVNSLTLWAINSRRSSARAQSWQTHEVFWFLPLFSWRRLRHKHIFESHMLRYIVLELCTLDKVLETFCVLHLGCIQYINNPSHEENIHICVNEHVWLKLWVKCIQSWHIDLNNERGGINPAYCLVHNKLN